MSSGSEEGSDAGVSNQSIDNTSPMATTKINFAGCFGGSALWAPIHDALLDKLVAEAGLKEPDWVYIARMLYEHSNLRVSAGDVFSRWCTRCRNPNVEAQWSLPSANMQRSTASSTSSTSSALMPNQDTVDSATVATNPPSAHSADDLYSDLTDHEREGLRQLSKKSTRWSPHELYVYVSTLKKYGDTKVGIDQVAARLKADPMSDKSRTQILSYHSNWNRRYSPILEWLKTYSPSSHHPRKRPPKSDAVNPDTSTAVNQATASAVHKQDRESKTPPAHALFSHGRKRKSDLSLKDCGSNDDDDDEEDGGNESIEENCYEDEEDSTSSSENEMVLLDDDDDDDDDDDEYDYDVKRPKMNPLPNKP